MGIIVDTETTGLLQPILCNNVYQPQIIEIYLGKFDEKTLEITDEFNSFVKPVNKMGQQILLEDPINNLKHICHITKIFDEHLTNAPTFDDIADEVYEFCKGEDLIVGHNVMFDLEVMMHNFIRIEKPELHNDFRRKFCTVEASYYIKKKRLKNDQLYKIATGRVIDGAHRAKNDALCTFDSYKWLLMEGSES